MKRKALTFRESSVFEHGSSSNLRVCEEAHVQIAQNMLLGLGDFGCSKHNNFKIFELKKYQTWQSTSNDRNTNLLNFQI